MSTPAESLQSVLTPSDQLAVTSDGDLTIEGAVAADLIARFGSPLFVFSEATLRANYRRARDAFAAVWPGPVNVMFAIKCNPNMAVRAVLHDEGAGGDCFGIPEIEATFAGGADPDKIALNGGNKTAEELERAIELGITINMDAAEEIDDVVAEMKGRATACVEALDAALSDRAYLQGDTMNAADLSICYVMRGYRRMVSEALPANVQAYFDRVTALPSYEAAVKADAETSERLKG